MVAELDRKAILVTGGSGLVGKAVNSVVDSLSDVFKKQPNETWIYLNSKDGDLRWK